MQNSTEFVDYAIKFFRTLNWVPAPTTELSRPDIIAWGTRDSGEQGCYCVIDTQAKLFKIVQRRCSATEILESKCVVHYDSDKIAIQRFEHYMDVTGMFYKEGWHG